MIFGSFLVIKFITAVLFIQFSNLKELHTKRELYRKMMKVIEHRKARGEWSHFGSGYVAPPDSRTISADAATSNKDIVMTTRIDLGLSSSRSAAAITQAGYTELLPRRLTVGAASPPMAPLPPNSGLIVQQALPPVLARQGSNDSHNSDRSSPPLSESGASSSNDNDSSVVNLAKVAALSSNPITSSSNSNETLTGAAIAAAAKDASTGRTPAQQAFLDLETLLTSHSFERAAKGEEGEDEESYTAQCGSRLPALPLSIQMPCRRIILHVLFLSYSHSFGVFPPLRLVALSNCSAYSHGSFVYLRSSCY
jgi:hypothetical protein